MISSNKLHTTLSVLADAQVCELVVEDIIFANAINNNYRTAKSFENFVKDCKKSFSFRRNVLLRKKLTEQYVKIPWEVQQRELRQPHLLFINRQYPKHACAYFRQQGLLSHMVREYEAL